ncbi:MAG: transposase [Nitrososphaerota archaeon]|nr:transposase [Nitrososphaerota archaeon]
MQYPIILTLIQFLKDVYHIFDSRSIDALNHFIQKYKNSEIDALAQYAKGLERDYEAVKNSLIHNEISNGPMEGMNSRIKELHRRSKGQAGIILLNAYVILAKC